MATPQPRLRRTEPLVRRAGVLLRDESTRALALPIAGVVLGLLMAGFGLFRGAPASIATVPPGYVAVVNGQGILMSDFIAETQTDNNETPFAKTTAAERARTLQQMIDHELLVQRALVLDLPETTTNVRNILVEAVNAQVDAPVDARQPSEAQLLDYFEAHRSAYTQQGSMTLRDLVLHYGSFQDADQSLPQALQDASEAVYELRSGTPLAAVMQRYGLVDSGRIHNTSYLDFAAKLRLGATLYAAALKLSTGQFSEPVVDSDGVHVLMMEQRQAPQPANFDAVRLEVYNAYQNAQKKEAEARNLQFLRSQAQIVVAPRAPRLPAAAAAAAAAASQ